MSTYSTETFENVENTGNYDSGTIGVDVFPVDAELALGQTPKEADDHYRQLGDLIKNDEDLHPLDY